MVPCPFTIHLTIITYCGSILRWRHLTSDAPTNQSLPSRAQVVICGGGIAGASLAYHLPKVGITDVILLEQGRSVL